MILADETKPYDGLGYTGSVSYWGFSGSDDESILSGTLTFTNDGSDTGVSEPSGARA